MKIERESYLPNALLESSIKQSSGEPVSVSEIMATKPTLLLFVRHFGCIGCTENIARLSPRFSELSDLGVRIAIIGCGAPMFIEGFKERNHLIGLPVEVFTDESLAVHKLADLKYDRWGAFRLRTRIEMIRAFVSGHVSGPIEGDIHQQAGAIFVDGSGVIRFYHRAESLGDHVDDIRLFDAALAACVNSHPELV